MTLGLGRQNAGENNTPFATRLVADSFGDVAHLHAMTTGFLVGPGTTLVFGANSPDNVFESALCRVQGYLVPSAPHVSRPSKGASP